MLLKSEEVREVARGHTVKIISIRASNGAVPLVAAARALH
jgi:hypothetical protein